MQTINKKTLRSRIKHNTPQEEMFVPKHLSQVRAAKYTYKGDTLSISELVDKYGGDLKLSYSTVSTRLRQGWSIAESLETPVRSLCVKLHEFRGKSQTLREWASEFEIPYGILKVRINGGLTFVEALKKPYAPAHSGKHRPIPTKNTYEYNGNLYTVRQLETKFGLTRSMLDSRLKSGMTLALAIETPRRRKRRKSK